MADKVEKVGVHVANPFTDVAGGSVFIKAGTQQVDADVAARWELAGRATILPHPEFHAGIFNKGQVPAWVDDVVKASAKAYRDGEAAADNEVAVPIETPVVAKGGKG